MLTPLERMSCHVVNCQIVQLWFSYATKSNKPNMQKSCEWLLNRNMKIKVKIKDFNTSGVNFVEEVKDLKDC